MNIKVIYKYLYIYAILVLVLTFIIFQAGGNENTPKIKQTKQLSYIKQQQQEINELENDYIIITLIIILSGIAISILWIVSLISAIKNDFINPTNRIMWIILLIFLPISCFVYPFIYKKQIINKK
jgi:hypothetical protein